MCVAGVGNKQKKAPWYLCGVAPHTQSHTYRRLLFTLSTVLAMLSRALFIFCTNTLRATRFCQVFISSNQTEAEGNPTKSE